MSCTSSLMALIIIPVELWIHLSFISDCFWCFHEGHSCEAPDPRKWKFPQWKFSVIDVNGGGKRVRWKAEHLLAIFLTDQTGLAFT